MNLVDSCGWLEYFADGPNADFFAPAIKNINKLLVPSICILEVFKKVLHQRGEDPALQVAALMQQGQVIDLSLPIALSAAKIGIDCKLPVVDSIILATARMNHAVLWTQDVDFKAIEGVKYIQKKK